MDSLPEVRGKYIENAKLAKHTWFGVGGPAEVLFLPEDADDLKTFLMRKPAAIPVTVIGGGSNLLIRDGGIPGVVVKLDAPAFRQVKFDGAEVTVGAGLKNSDLKKALIDNGVGGLEFICSVPGRIGGLLRTNAGCILERTDLRTDRASQKDADVCGLDDIKHQVTRVSGNAVVRDLFDTHELLRRLSAFIFLLFFHTGSSHSKICCSVI